MRDFDEEIKSILSDYGIESKEALREIKQVFEKYNTLKSNQIFYKDRPMQLPRSDKKYFLQKWRK